MRIFVLKFKLKIHQQSAFKESLTTELTFKRWQPLPLHYDFNS